MAPAGQFICNEEIILPMLVRGPGLHVSTPLINGSWKLPVRAADLAVQVVSVHGSASVRFYLEYAGHNKLWRPAGSYLLISLTPGNSATAVLSIRITHAAQYARVVSEVTGDEDSQVSYQANAITYVEVEVPE